ncbi:MAG TPA: phage holin family protein [Gaiellales bacterium]|nr:phage holin family protein [Gaiellales bacterium]
MRDRSMGELTKQLSQDVSELVRRELKLAKTEASAKARKVVSGAVMIGAGVVLALVMVGAVVAAAVMALDIALPDWLSAIIVALVAGIGGGLLALAGMRSIRRATPPVPRETIESVKEDVAWTKERAKSGMR